MRELLGLSIGATNFVAVPAGGAPVVRGSQLTLFPHRAPLIGAAARVEHGEKGLPVTGFVELLGGREPVVAPDGSTHLPDLLTVDAIDAMVTVARASFQDLAIAIPGYWSATARETLLEALTADTDRSTSGEPPFLVSDAVATLTALDSDLGVPSSGVVALLDFGGSGTGITLADAGFGFQPIGETAHYRDFSGNLIDQAILAHVLSGDARAEMATEGTAAVGDVTELVDACRAAKERLSDSEATEMVAPLPSGLARIRMTRRELEELIADPLDGAIAALTEALRSHGIGEADLTAIALSGGGARIPLVAERVATAHRRPVVIARQPIVAAAMGATLCAARQTEAGLQAATVSAPGALAATALAPAAGSRGGAAGPPGAPPVAGGLAWSQENLVGVGVVPFVEEDHEPTTGRRAAMPAPPPPGRSPHRLSRLVLAAAALVALIAVFGVLHGLMSGSHGPETTPQPADTTAPSSSVAATTRSSASSSSLATTTPPSAEPSQAPAPEPSAEEPEPSTAETTAEQVETTEPAATTAAPETTQPVTTTAPPAATTATTAPPTTAAAPPTSVAPSPTVQMTTEYLNIPLVPIPIPIQVPVG